MHEHLLDILPESYLQLDNFGVIQYCNSATSDLTGYSKKDLYGKPLRFLTQDPEDDIKSQYHLNSASLTGRSTFQGRYRKQGGDLYWAETTLVPVPASDQQSPGFSCIVRDITERRRQELYLEESEERFRLLVEGVQDYAIYMLGIDGLIITWNDGARKLTGYTTEEIKGKHFSTLYTANDLADSKPQRELQEARDTGKYQEYGWRMKKNGSVFWASIVLTAIYNDENKLLGFSKVMKDLTEQNTDESALRQSEERYRLLVEQVTDYAIFMLDEKGRIVSWNAGAKRIKGYEPDEIIGKYFSIFYPEEEIYNGKPAYELKVARQVGRYEEEGWRLRKDGSRFWANVVITAIYDPGGVLKGFSKVTRDLTERKKAEQAEREISAKYRQMAYELEAINHQLSKTNYDLEQFTSIVAHDLQEPLRSMKSFLHLANEKTSKGEYQSIAAYLSKSMIAAGRMKELIENVLSYSQVNKGQIHTTHWPLAELIEQVKQNLKAALDASGAEIVSEVAEKAVITGDRVQLVQLLQNLISNAVKFTERQVPRVILSYTHKQNGSCHFSVSDNGIGIDADSTLKIFDPFKRLHQARTYAGAGMGLAICKRVVERHQGRIWVESTPGLGSTFHFTIWDTAENQVTDESV